ncbi:MAG: hypothetical protein HY805_04160 [Nitrospirae bacterium]|nr:hypothetical protein [Nitrospirota bacterium]
MKTCRIRELIPSGPMLGITLIGLLLLSGVLYYRAVKNQRFLEPALAISQPKMQFAENLTLHIEKEFGDKKTKGIKVTKDFILVEKSLLSSIKGHDNIRKLSQVFLGILKDPSMKNYVDSIIIVTEADLSTDTEINRKRLSKTQHFSEEILFSLYDAEPELKRNFNTYFAATSMYVDPMSEDKNIVKFMIVPSEQLHIDVLRRFEKYVH